MKVIHIGVFANAPSFYVRMTEKVICGYSKTIELGDVLTLDGPRAFGSGYRITGLEKRDYYGSFKNPEDAKNAFYTADVVRLTTEEVREIAKDEDALGKMFI